MRLSARSFERKEEHSIDELEERDEVQPKTALLTFEKLKYYTALTTIQAEKFARVVEPQILTDILSDAPILQHFLSLDPCSISYVKAALPKPKQLSFIEELLIEDSCNLVGDDETIRFLKATANDDKGASPLQW